MNEAWIIYYLHQLNMDKEEAYTMEWGLFLDLLACMAVSNGNAELKQKKTWRYEDAIALR